MKNQTLALIACLAGAAGMAAAADTAPRHDLFARPKLAPEAAGEPASAARSDWHPPLRAIVLAGERSLVKIGNVVVELGGEIEGWRLVRVAEDKAVFTRGRQRVALTMGGVVGDVR